MMRAWAAVLAALLVVAAALEARETPVEKVLGLLNELKDEVVADGKKEAEIYDKFACFCKDTTDDKSKAIMEKQVNVDDFQATIEEQSAISAEKGLKIVELEQQIDSITKEMEKIEAMREKEHETFEANDADLGQGVVSLEGAIDEMKAGTHASLLNLGRNVRRTVAIADTLGMTTKRNKKTVALLQDPDYEAHEGSMDIIETLGELDEDFKDKKQKVEDEEAQAKKDHKAAMEAKQSEKETAETEKEATTAEKEEADKALGEAMEAKTLEEAALADDKLYLKDLTMQCELKAREFDQHSKVRADEVAALTKALEIVGDRVKGADEAANKRAFLQQPKTATAQRAAGSRAAVEEVAEAASFLQLSSAPRGKLALLVQSRAGSVASRHERVKRAVEALAAAGTKLGSPALSALATKLGLNVQADPFVKVKKLIQDLIERLVKEATEEATKKGWCDAEMGKATHTRDENMQKVSELNAEAESLEAQKTQLEDKIMTTTSELAELNDALAKATKTRSDEKAENETQLKEADEGLTAVKEAYVVLEDFYKGAKKEEVPESFAQTKASPVDEDAPEAPKGGAYKGGQQKAGGILAMLDVIISDFERTIKVTNEAEKDSLREFTEFDRASKTSIASKESSKSQDESQLKATVSGIAETMSLLEKHMKMLDDVLMELEDLKPACVDSGMSYEERVQKRKDEIEALKSALCLLDTEKVEDDCA